MSTPLSLYPFKGMNEKPGCSLVIVPVMVNEKITYGLFCVNELDVSMNDQLFIETDGGEVICCGKKGCKKMIGFRNENSEILNILSELSADELKNLGTFIPVKYYIRTPIRLYASENDALEAVQSNIAYLAADNSFSDKMREIHDPWYVIEKNKKIGGLLCQSCKP